MDETKKIVNLDLDSVLPNRFQPRREFKENSLDELVNSIKEHGVIQPITVRPIGNKYEIVAGERRYKASILAGKDTIPAIVTNLDDSSCAEIALIENVQRQNLSPIEEALSYKKILDMGNSTQEALASKLGKKQSTISNKLRLLNLDDEVQKALLENKISERHARSLLRLDNKEQENMLNRIINERLTVRRTDEEIQKVIDEKKDKVGENMNNEMNNLTNNMEGNGTNPNLDQVQNNIFGQTVNPNPIDINSLIEQAQKISEEEEVPAVQSPLDSIPTPPSTEIPSMPAEPVANNENNINNTFGNNEIPSVPADNAFMGNNDIPVNPQPNPFEQPTSNAFVENNVEKANPTPNPFEQPTSNVFVENNAEPVNPTQNPFENETPSMPAENTFVNPTAPVNPEPNVFVPEQPAPVNPEPTANQFVEPTVNNQPDTFEMPVNNEQAMPNTFMNNEPQDNNQGNFDINSFNIPTTPIEEEKPSEFRPISVDTIDEEETPIDNNTPIVEDTPAEIEPKIPPLDNSIDNQDINQAINEIKNLGDKLESNGFNISVEEFDLADSYQITFRIMK